MPDPIYLLPHQDKAMHMIKENTYAVLVVSAIGVCGLAYYEKVTWADAFLSVGICVSIMILMFIFEIYEKKRLQKNHDEYEKIIQERNDRKP